MIKEGKDPDAIREELRLPKGTAQIRTMQEVMCMAVGEHDSRLYPRRDESARYLEGLCSGHKDKVHDGCDRQGRAQEAQTEKRKTGRAFLIEHRVTTILWASEEVVAKVLTALSIIKAKRGVYLVLCVAERDRDLYGLWQRGVPSERVVEAGTIGEVTAYLRGKYGKKKGGTP